jgi:hypothetical protein
LVQPAQLVADLTSVRRPAGDFEETCPGLVVARDEAAAPRTAIADNN